MPTKYKQACSLTGFNTAEAGRNYIARLFETVLRRHDYRHYITGRLAGDFACTLAQHFEDIKARELALQQRLTAADELNDVLGELLRGAAGRIEDLADSLGNACEGFEGEDADDPQAEDECEEARQFCRKIRAALKPAEVDGDEA